MAFSNVQLHWKWLMHGSGCVQSLPCQKIQTFAIWLVETPSISNINYYAAGYSERANYNS